MNVMMVCMKFFQSSTESCDNDLLLKKKEKKKTVEKNCEYCNFISKKEMLKQLVTSAKLNFIVVNVI
jgi:uncharacterized protein (DUF169 family)